MQQAGKDYFKRREETLKNVRHNARAVLNKLLITGRTRRLFYRETTGYVMDNDTMKLQHFRTEQTRLQKMLGRTGSGTPTSNKFILSVFEFHKTGLTVGFL